MKYIRMFNKRSDLDSAINMSDEPILGGNNDDEYTKLLLLIQQNNEIWYTSADESIVTPAMGSGGENPTSNKYENGLGIITFSNAITTIVGEEFTSSNIRTIILPNTVTIVDAKAFENCPYLESVTLPAGLREIGYDAFKDCPTLHTITFKGTMAQWNAITFGNDWNLNTPMLTYVTCSDGIVRL